jgi:hypothetical protein
MKASFFMNLLGFMDLESDDDNKLMVETPNVEAEFKTVSPDINKSF